MLGSYQHACQLSFSRSDGMQKKTSNLGFEVRGAKEALDTLR